MAAASATEIAPADVDAEPIAGEATESSQEAASIGAWASCFGEALKPSDYPTRTGRDVSWRAVVAGPRAVRTAALRTYRAESAARRTLAVLGDPADENSRAAALQAARDAIATKCLVVLTTSPDFTGFFASLQAEHPDIGVTVLRIPVTENAPKLASRYAYTEPGTFRELVIAPDGSIYEPVMDDMKLTQGGAFPLRSEDVVLVSRGTRGAGLALAQVLACCGTPVAVVGRATEGDDSALVAGLEQLRSAGARIGYEIIDIANPASLAAAIERVEARLGPVAAIGHAAGSGDHVPLMNLTDAEISDHIASEAATLDRLVGSVRPDQLRMIVTFGSVAGRYGQAGGTMLALGSGALAARAANLAAGTPDCRSLHVDMPTWSAGGPGDLPQLAEQIEDSGTTPIDLGVAARLLLKIMTTPGLPDRLAVHGRVSGPAAKAPDVLGAADLAAAGLADGARFLQEVKAHYPGLELVCEARLSMQTDPYLADYRVDGLPVLPPVLALEALAQAASVVAGRPAREARNVRLESPIVVPAGGEAELRVSAQRTGDTITAVLRCSESSFAVDHARAEFPCAATQAEMPRAELAKAPAAMSKITSSSSGLVDGAELYGPISFQSGRFRRVALLPEVTARSCRALARGDDQKPWFAPDSGLAHSEFVLGSPGMNDATLHAVQACVPHRRIRPAGCESVVFSGRIAEGPVEIRAVAERGDGTESEAHTAVPETEMMALVEAVATTPDEDADQQLAASRPQGRRGRRSRKQLAGQQRHPVAASITKARAATARAQKGRSGQNGAPHEEAPHEDAPHEEAQNSAQSTAVLQIADEVRPQPSGPAGQAQSDHGAVDGTRRALAPRQLADQLWNIEAVDSTGQLLVAWRGAHFRDAGPLPRTSAWPPSLLSVYLERVACELGLDSDLRVAVGCGQPDLSGSQFLSTAVPRQASRAEEANGAKASRHGVDAATVNTATAQGSGPLAGFSLVASAIAPVACGWSAAEPGPRHDQLAGGLAPAYSQLRSLLAEPPGTLAARLRAIRACVAMAGLRAGEQASCERTTNDGWAVIELPTARLACTVVDLSGVSSPVAVAILTGHTPVDSGGNEAQNADQVPASAR